MSKYMMGNGNDGLNVTDKMMVDAVNEVKTLINTYHPGIINKGKGLYRMFNEYDGIYWRNKGWIINAMEKHPNYNGRYQIVLPHVPMNRYINRARLNEFKDYIKGYKFIRFMNDELGIASMRFRMAIINAIVYCINYVDYNDDNIANENLAHDVNAGLSVIDPESTFIKTKSKREIAKKGMKITRIVQQIAIKYGLDKHVDVECIEYCNAQDEWVEKKKDMGWNYQFSSFSDAATELTKYGTLVISAHYIDYLTSSFGKGWSSCHTIDKDNIRKMTNTYSGMYMGGTLSYMLDSATLVVYYLPDGYNRDKPELEEKLKRCLFYIGYDKIIQSRVYPDGRDAYDGRDGDQKSLSADIRDMVIDAMKVMFDIPDDEFFSTDYSSYRIAEIISNDGGVQYPDYYHYGDCNVTYFNNYNMKKIIIGKTPICPECGENHSRSGDLFCRDCRNGIVQRLY